MNTQIKVIQPGGIFDSRNGKPIQEEINELIESGIKTFLMDFQSVHFMDSSGFGILILIVKTIHEKKARFALCSINEQIRMILEMSGTSQIFEVFPDRVSFIETVTQKHEQDMRNKEGGFKIRV